MKHKPYIDQEYPTTNREYKDGLFRLVFQKKEDLLSLYNAGNDLYVAFHNSFPAGGFHFGRG